jgi:hypothetical protein
VSSNSPEKRHSLDSSSPLSSANTRSSQALNSAISALPSLPNPYKNLPWITEREQQREQRRLTNANAALFRELGLPEDATYEDVAAKTDHLIELAAGDIKKKIRVEIARDKIYMIRLNERITGVRRENDDAYIASKWEEKGREGLVELTDSVDDIIKPKAAFKIPVISGLIEYFQSIYKPPDENWTKRQAVIWGASTLVCLISPPLTENFARLNWLAAGGMMGYRGMPGMENREAGYNPFRGKRNKKHQVQAMGIAIMLWVVAKGMAESVVMKFPALAASRSCEWFKFAIVQGALGLATAFIQTYKEGEDSGELMI